MNKKIQIGKRAFTTLFADHLRMLTDREKQRLKNSIRRYGVLIPIVVDEDDGIIDGIARADMSSELGLHSIPCDVRKHLTLDQKRELAISLNLSRRHLSIAEQEKIRHQRVQWALEKRRQTYSAQNIVNDENSDTDSIKTTAGIAPNRVDRDHQFVLLSALDSIGVFLEQYDDLAEIRPILAAAERARSSIAIEPSSKKVGGQALVILNRLQQGRVGSDELCRIVKKYTGRISELRKAGHVVRCLNKKLGIYALFVDDKEVGS